MLIKKGIIESASSAEPKVEIIFIPVNPSEAR
jgi:hypothetical protein